MPTPQHISLLQARDRVAAFRLDPDEIPLTARMSQEHLKSIRLLCACANNCNTTTQERSAAFEALSQATDTIYDCDEILDLISNTTSNLLDQALTQGDALAGIQIIPYLLLNLPDKIKEKLANRLHQPASQEELSATMYMAFHLYKEFPQQCASFIKRCSDHPSASISFKTELLDTIGCLCHKPSINQACDNDLIQINHQELTKFFDIDPKAAFDRTLGHWMNCPDDQSYSTIWLRKANELAQSNPTLIFQASRNAARWTWPKSFEMVEEELEADYRHHRAHIAPHATMLWEQTFQLTCQVAPHIALAECLETLSPQGLEFGPDTINLTAAKHIAAYLEQANEQEFAQVADKLQTNAAESALYEWVPACAQRIYADTPRERQSM